MMTDSQAARSASSDRRKQRESANARQGGLRVTGRRAVPEASSPATRAIMKGNRGRDTKPELSLRSLLHARGLRYRVGPQIRVGGIRTHPDLLFSGARLAIFIDGCFWHMCARHRTLPRTNSAYWLPKLQRSVERDRAATTALEAAGWRVLRLWEHLSADEMLARVLSALGTGIP